MAKGMNFTESAAKDGWDGWADAIPWDNRILEKLLPHIVTCHLHDNDGYGDGHQLPGTGSIDWKTLIPALKNCPRIVSMQNETSAGAHHISIAKLCRTFDALMKL